MFRTFSCSRCADLKPFWVHHVLNNNVKSKQTHTSPIFICVILNDTQIKHSQTHGKHNTHSTSTPILCWNTILRAQVKHTKVFSGWVCIQTSVTEIALVPPLPFFSSMFISKPDLILPGDLTAVSLQLTYWGRDKMADIFETTFSHAFSWMKMYKFW